jgi:hypothetical protein
VSWEATRNLMMEGENIEALFRSTGIMPSAANEFCHFDSLLHD